MARLPTNWAIATFEEITDPRVSQNGPLSDPFTYIDIGAIDNRSKQIVESKFVARHDAPSRARQNVRAGDVLVSMTRPNLNAVALISRDFDAAVASTGFAVLRPIEILSEWIFAAVRTPAFVEEMTAKVQGALYPAVRPSDVRQFKVPIPPREEQIRITKVLEQARSRSELATTALNKESRLVEALRQSILAAAFRGDLTADWRKKHPDIEPSSVLLERIRKERRQQWEETELAKMQGKGKVPSNDRWKQKYVEPQPIDATNLPHLPSGWCWAKWGEVSEWITYGFTRPMPHVRDGPPIITARHIYGGKINFSDFHRTTKSAFNQLSDKDRPQQGDILITKDGTIGRAAVVERDSGNFCINQSVAVVYLRSCPLDRNYLLRAIEAPFTQKAIADQARGMALQHLSITDFAELPFPLSPLAEQGEIVTRAEAALASVAAIGDRIAETTDRLREFESAILAKAFRGELVPQDPNDEAAAVLLERIRAERSAFAADVKPASRRQNGRIRVLAGERPRLSIQKREERVKRAHGRIRRSEKR